VYAASVNKSNPYLDPAPVVEDARLQRKPVMLTAARSGFGEWHDHTATALGSYANNYRQEWVLAPVAAKSIEIKITKLSTERYRDKVKIYEGSPAKGLGALVAVLHGKELPAESVVVHASTAYVVFSTDEAGVGQGFWAEFRTL